MTRTADKVSITITIQDVPPSGNKWQRMHWAERGRVKSAWKRTIWALIQRQDRSWLMSMCEAHKVMHVEICLSHKKLYDTDNAYTSVKPVLDALRELKFLYEDAPAYLHLKVTQEKSPDGCTRIFCCEAEGDRSAHHG